MFLACLLISNILTEGIAKTAADERINRIWTWPGQPELKVDDLIKTGGPGVVIGNFVQPQTSAEYDRIKEELAQATKVKAKPIAQKIPATEIVAALLEAARLPPRIKEEASPAYRHRLRLVWRRNLAMVVLALKSSRMRVGELVSLRREDLDDARQGAWVTGKGRKMRFVAFDDEAWVAIQLAER